MTYSHALCWNEISIYDKEKLDRNNIVKVVRKNHFSTSKCSSRTNVLYKFNNTN